MKQCTRCKKRFSLDRFYAQKQRGKNGQVWGYHDAMCKRCRSEYTSERRRETKLEAILYKGGVCNGCGLSLKDTHPSVFDFHHVDPSHKSFSPGKQNLCFERIKKELDKCILLCANCHRILHATENAASI